MLNRIYVITNQINGKQYIGKTCLSIEARFKEHLGDASRERNEKRPLYEAMRKYGKENFTVELVEDNISFEDINEKEMYYIKKYNTYIGFENSNGYNATLGGDGKKYKDYSIQEIIESYYQNQQNAAEVGRIFNLDDTYITRLLNSNGIQTRKSGDYSKEFMSKKVGQFDVNTNQLINEFSSIADAKRYLQLNKTNGHLKDVLNNKFKTHKAYGYLWYFI